MCKQKQSALLHAQSLQAAPRAVPHGCSGRSIDLWRKQVTPLPDVHKIFKHACSGRQLQEVIAKDGVLGLFGRGLKTKILANGMQGMLFTVSTRLRQRTSFFRVPCGPCGAASWNTRCIYCRISRFSICLSEVTGPSDTSSTSYCRLPPSRCCGAWARTPGTR